MDYGLEGKSVIVTGASVGFGKALAEALYIQGAYVTMCARSNLLEEVAENIRLKNPTAKGKILAKVADISCEQDVDLLMKASNNSFGKIDGIVCNAGVYGPKGRIDQINRKEWIKAIEINLLGTVLCCSAVAPYLIKNLHGKIVIMSGGGATKPMPYLSAYAASKAGVVRFAETIAGELAPFNIDVNSVAPGALKTRLVDEIIEAGPEKVGEEFYNANIRVKEKDSDSTEQAIKLCSFLLSNQSHGINGKLISAVWDPWEQWPMAQEKLMASDVFTLRRIVPEDRKGLL